MWGVRECMDQASLEATEDSVNRWGFVKEYQIVPRIIWKGWRSRPFIEFSRNNTHTTQKLLVRDVTSAPPALARQRSHARLASLWWLISPSMSQTYGITVWNPGSQVCTLRTEEDGNWFLESLPIRWNLPPGVFSVKRVFTQVFTPHPHRGVGIRTELWRWEGLNQASKEKKNFLMWQEYESTGRMHRNKSGFLWASLSRCGQLGGSIKYCSLWRVGPLGFEVE